MNHLVNINEYYYAWGMNHLNHLRQNSTQCAHSIDAIIVILENVSSGSDSIWPRNDRKILVSQSLSAFYLFVCLCILFPIRVSSLLVFVTIKILFCHLGHNSQRSWFPSFHHFKFTAACRISTEWIREKGSEIFFLSCCIRLQVEI